MFAGSGFGCGFVAQWVPREDDVVCRHIRSVKDCYNEKIKRAMSYPSSGAILRLTVHHGSLLRVSLNADRALFFAWLSGSHVYPPLDACVY